MLSPKKYSYLALGDSYTIGEGIPLAESFPYQTIQLLRKAGYDFQAAEIIAKTGWTTDELLEAITQTIFATSYDFVSLLIGVNNQYRGLSVEDYSASFEILLQKAISFSDKRNDHVFVLSIPDWGVTPIAIDRNPAYISEQIDLFNEVNKNLSLQYNVNYIDITEESRKAATDETLLAMDKLHPSGKAICNGLLTW
jgi:lysophospholipase L1-like esterase